MAILTRWAGPLLGLLGILGIALIAMQAPASRSITSWWILASALSFERVLPLVGLGAALTLVSRRQSLLGVIAFLLGAILGFEIRLWFMALMAPVPGASGHLFFTGSISSIAAGLLLIAPARAKAWLLVPGALLIGTMLAIAIKLTDPTVDNPLVSRIGVTIGLWVVAAVALTGRSFYQGWFPIALRILGSWLLAIGLLYGGASLIKRPTLLPLPSPPPKPLQRPAVPGSEKLFPKRDAPYPGLPLGRQPDP